MSTNLLVSFPSCPVRCIQLNDIFLKNLGQEGHDLFYSHCCDYEDTCRRSLPCLRSEIYKIILSKLYNIDLNKFYLVINRTIDPKYNTSDHSSLHDIGGYSRFNEFITVTILFKLLGGKGGFGKILKTQASKKRQSNNLDSCRNLQGQRIRTVRLSQQMNKWNEQQSSQEKAGKDVFKLPKKEDLSETIKKEDFCDEKYIETVKKEVTKVKSTVLRGFEKKLDRECQESKLKGEIDLKRSTVLDSCLDVYDL